MPRVPYRNRDTCHLRQSHAGTIPGHASSARFGQRQPRQDPPNLGGGDAFTTGGGQREREAKMGGGVGCQNGREAMWGHTDTRFWEEAMLSQVNIDWAATRGQANVFHDESGGQDRKSTRLNSSHSGESRMPSSA